MGNLFHSEAHERLAQHLEEGGEVLLQKALNFIEYGLLQDAAGEDLHKPFAQKHSHVRQLEFRATQDYHAVFPRKSVGGAAGAEDPPTTNATVVVFCSEGGSWRLLASKKSVRPRADM